jgi:hypothetical protein
VQAELSQFVASFQAAWHSPPRLELDEWADEYRVLSGEASAEPGRWRTDRVPYLREIMRTITDPAVEQVVVVAASQTAKTELLAEYARVLYSSISFADTVRRASRRGLQGALEGPHRADAARQPGPEGQGQGRALARQWKHAGPQAAFSGGAGLDAGGRQQRRRPVDAPDPGGVAGRGEPLPGQRRHRGRPGHPGGQADHDVLGPQDRDGVEPGAGGLVPHHGGLRGDRPAGVSTSACPHCDERQVLDWSRVEWEKDETVSPRRHFPETAAYHCKFCGAAWTDAQRWAPCPAASGSRRTRQDEPAGFRISQLYSPWKRMGELAQEYLESRGNMEREKAFQNTALGLPYRVSGVTADAERLYERREGYRRGEVPDRALVLTAGVDVHPTAWSARSSAGAAGWRAGASTTSSSRATRPGPRCGPSSTSTSATRCGSGPTARWRS